MTSGRSVENVATAPATGLESVLVEIRNLTKYYLRRGMPFGGILDEPSLSWWIGAKNFFKRISSAARSEW